MTNSLSESDSERTTPQPARIGAGLLVCVLLIGCAQVPEVNRGADPVAPSSPIARGWLDHGELPAVLRLSTYPATPAQLRTTSGEIYVGNLDARIAHLEKVYAEQPRADVAQALALTLSHRFRILGRLGDATRAGAVIDEQLQVEPSHPQLLLGHARWLAQFHQFEPALQALDRIAAPGTALQTPMIELREEINLALGRYAELGETFWRPQQPGEPELYALANRGNAAVLQGKLDLASRLYFDAQARYRDVGPYPLAWLHTQQGIALLRFGHYTEAAKFFRTARERLPQYYLATEHLAECLTQLGQFDEARALYVEVIAQTGNPEFMAAMAGLELAAGNSEQAERWRVRADDGYQSLLDRFPAAYAQHAAEFYLEFGDPARAKALAEQNLLLRKDLGSRLLLAEVAATMGDSALACSQMALATETGLNPPELQQLQQHISCP